MDTFRVSRYLDTVIKLASLGVVLLVPLAMPAFQPELDYAYGEYKRFILHFGALIIAVGLAGSLVTAFFRKSRSFDLLQDVPFHLSRNRSFIPAHVLIFGMVSLVGAFLISTLMSPMPLISFYGVYEEFNGTNFYDFISLFIVFLAFALKLRNQRDLKLLLTVLSVVLAAMSLWL